MSEHSAPKYDPNETVIENEILDSTAAHVLGSVLEDDNEAAPYSVLMCVIRAIKHENKCALFNEDADAEQPTATLRWEHFRNRGFLAESPELLLHGLRECEEKGFIETLSIASGSAAKRGEISTVRWSWRWRNYQLTEAEQRRFEEIERTWDEG